MRAFRLRLISQSSSLSQLTSRTWLSSIGALTNPCSSISVAARLARAVAGLLVGDIVMPGMQGQDLARIVRERFPEAQVVFMSGYDSDDVIGRETRHGGARFLPKPFTPDELRTMVSEALASTGTGES